MAEPTQGEKLKASALTRSLGFGQPKRTTDFSREEKEYSINKAATTRAHNGYNEQDEQNNSNNAITHKTGNNNVIKSHEMTNKEKKLAHKTKRKSRKSFSFSNNANFSGKFISKKIFVPL